VPKSIYIEAEFELPLDGFKHCRAAKLAIELTNLSAKSLKLALQKVGAEVPGEATKIQMNLRGQPAVGCEFPCGADLNALAFPTAEAKSKR
jgi:hypothetical protein